MRYSEQTSPEMLADWERTTILNELMLELKSFFPLPSKGEYTAIRDVTQEIKKTIKEYLDKNGKSDYYQGINSAINKFRKRAKDDTDNEIEFPDPEIVNYMEYDSMPTFDPDEFQMEEEDLRKLIKEALWK